MRTRKLHGPPTLSGSSTSRRPRHHAAVARVRDAPRARPETPSPSKSEGTQVERVYLLDGEETEGNGRDRRERGAPESSSNVG